jgi:glycosyltransferase involved in cell wall biosynthesis
MQEIPPLRVAINAHLLSGQAGYRSAGIHAYIAQTLAHLPALAPTWHFNVYLGQGLLSPTVNMTLQRSPLPTANPLWRIFWEQAIQPWTLARHRPDLYHSQAFSLPPQLRVPSLVTLYDLSFLRYPQILSRARRLYLQAVSRDSCRRAARLVAISRHTAQDISTFFDVPMEKISLASPGVSPAFCPLPHEEVEAFRQAQNLPPRFIFYLGTLEPRKNLLTLLQAYARLPRALRREVPLFLAGGKGWGYEPIFEALAQPALATSVRWLGYLATENLPLWYNAAELFVYPSRYEGWGLPVLEALACGTLVLTSDISSLPEAAGPAGVLVPPDEVEAWTVALGDMLNNPSAHAHRRALGLAWARQFTWQATARATLEAYQAVWREYA